MPALEAGRQAPDISLPTMEGARFSLAEALKHGPVVAAFFKITCPVCQFAMPYIDKLSKAYGNGTATVIGVSQNAKQDTAAFLKEFDVSFPVALDPSGSYPASNAYGLTNVPSIFVIEPDGKIALSSVGWSKADVDAVNARLAQVSGKPRADIYGGADVPEWKAG